MHFISPLIEDQKRRRALGKTVQDGEHVDFDLAFFDSAPRTFMTDSAAMDSAIRAAVDRAHALHDHKFAFMGDAAPKFDRERAEFLARSKASSANGAALRDSLSEGRYSPMARTIEAPETGSASSPGGRSLTDALRFARYEG